MTQEAEYYYRGGWLHHYIRHVTHNQGIVTVTTVCGLSGSNLDTYVGVPDGTLPCLRCANSPQIKRLNLPYPYVENSMTKKSMPTVSAINPKHYDLVVGGRPIEVADLIEARFHDNAHLSQAVKYIFRAGHKTDSSYVKDISKAIWWLVRSLMFHGVKDIELPPGAPVSVPKE